MLGKYEPCRKLGKGRDGKIGKMSGFCGGVVGKRDNERKLGYTFVDLVGRDREEMAGVVCVDDDRWGGAYIFFQ